MKTHNSYILHLVMEWETKLRAQQMYT